jgi:hypothetical protein
MNNKAVGFKFLCLMNHTSPFRQASSLAPDQLLGNPSHSLDSTSRTELQKVSAYYKICEDEPKGCKNVAMTPSPCWSPAIGLSVSAVINDVSDGKDVMYSKGKMM